jgi:hypothetical protein
MSVIHLGVAKARSRLDDGRRPDTEMAISMPGNNSATGKCTIRRRRTIEAPTLPTRLQQVPRRSVRKPSPACAHATDNQPARLAGTIVEIDVTAIVPLK